MKNFITFITDTIFCLFFKLFNKVFNLDFVLLSHQLGTNNERGKWSKKSILRTASYSRLKAERAYVLCTFVLQQ